MYPIRFVACMYAGITVVTYCRLVFYVECGEANPAKKCAVGSTVALIKRRRRERAGARWRVVESSEHRGLT